MPTVKCVQCGSDNDPAETAGYCDDCGKKLPGLYTPPRTPAPAVAKDDPDEIRPRSGGNFKGGLNPRFVFGIVSAVAAILGGIALIFFGLTASGVVAWLVTVGAASVIGFVVALCGAFASRERLLALAPWIGTKNPVLARVVCWVALLFFLGLAGGAVYLGVTGLSR